MGFDDTCNTGLVLGLGLISSTAPPATPPSTAPPPDKPLPSTADHHPFEPSLTLALSVPGKTTAVINNHNHQYFTEYSNSTSYKACEEAADHFFRQASSPLDSGVSSFSSGGGRVLKRERDMSSEETTEVDDKMMMINNNSSSRVISDEDDDGVNTRKKLRLTKDQSALLEQSFKQQSTLNPKQKQALARQLNLRPRQVEVWFQNRRARTKLKQTEVDCEVLKKCCETLTEENRRLQKEVQELKALKLAAQPFYMHMPAATLTMCPSCERIAAAAAADGGGSNTQFSMAPNKPPHNHFFITPFTNPSAAC